MVTTSNAQVGEKKMATKNSTLIVAIIDRSGSMAVCEKDMRGGFDTFVKDQQAQPGECTMTLVRFDTVYETVFESRPIKGVGPLVLDPRGGTALLDALGMTISTVGQQLAALPKTKRPSKVVVLVITDGEENSSKEYSLTTVRTMLTHQQDVEKWQFIYLGANQDAITVAAHMGIPTSNAMSYNTSARGIHNTANSVSASVSSYRSGATQETSFSDEDRANAIVGDS